MAYLFIYDHLMDPCEFKQCFPNVEFKFFGIGRLDNFKINWIAKGLPFCCRTRPTLTPSSNTETYGVIIEINSYEKKMISEYIKYLPNNLLIEANAVTFKSNNFGDIGKNSNKDMLFFNSEVHIPENRISFDLKVITFCTESSNMIFDSTFTDFLLKKQGEFSNSMYLTDLNKSSKKISPALPSENYVNLITKVAKFYKLPDFYIEENLNLSSQKLSFFESIVRTIALKYIYFITKFHIQGVGYGVIDLLWELDPQDPLVFVDYGKINKGIVFLITTLIIALFSPILCFIIFWWKK